MAGPSPELCVRLARRCRCSARPVASSSMCSSSPASSCGSKGTAGGPGGPPGTAGSTHPSSRQTGGSWGHEAQFSKVLTR